MTLHSSSSYPVRGIAYLISHSGLWRHVLRTAAVVLLFSMIASFVLFVFACPMQAESLSEHIPSGLSWIIAFFLTLIEIGISVLIFSSLFLAYYMDVIFDAVWRRETMGTSEEPVRPSFTPSVSCIKSFLILIIVRVILLVVTSPLNLIPCLGTMFYLYINGFYYAWSLHCRYFDLIGLSFAQGQHFVKENRSDYTRFGIVGVFLEMIPVLNLITPVTNVIGSALWACDIERFKEPIGHPRSYLLAPSPETLEQGQVDYGATKSEKDQLPPPPYQEPTIPQIYPSAPVAEKQ